MNDEEIKRIVRETVYETLGGLGVDAKQQHEVQADFLYIRKIRKGSEAASRNIRTTAITIIIPSLIYMFWEALKEALRR